MTDDTPGDVQQRYECRRTQKWLGGGVVREKRQFFRLHRDDPDRPDIVTRRERVVTFYTRLHGRDRIDNELWFTTNDPAQRESIRAELRDYVDARPVASPMIP